jgi:flagellar protein FliJ
MKLKKLIQYRKWKEERSQNEFAQKKELLFKETNRLRMLEEKRAEGQNNFLPCQVGTISPELLRLYTNFIAGITTRCQIQTREVEKARVEAEEKRLELLKCSQERKAIEKLMEKAEEEARKAQDKIEQQFLDEISLQTGCK